MGKDDFEAHVQQTLRPVARERRYEAILCDLMCIRQDLVELTDDQALLPAGQRAEVKMVDELAVAVDALAEQERIREEDADGH